MADSKKLKLAPLVCFEILDASDEEVEPPSLGIFLDLKEAIAAAHRWVEDSGDGDFLRVEIKRRPLNEIHAYNPAVWEKEWEWSEDKDQWVVSAGDDQVSAFDEEVQNV